jgi:hypothetical protein
MRLNRTGPALRRLALVLGAAQLLAYGAAPVLHGLTDRSPGPAHVEAASDRTCVPAHAASACVVCQMLTLQAHRPETVRVVVGDDEARAGERNLLLAAPPRAPPPGFLTRAPPTPLG